jgi:hypothetical protein
VSTVMVQGLQSLMPARSRCHRLLLGFASAAMSIQSSVGTREEEEQITVGDAIAAIRSGSPRVTSHRCTRIFIVPRHHLKP